MKWKIIYLRCSTHLPVLFEWKNGSLLLYKFISIRCVTTPDYKKCFLHFFLHRKMLRWITTRMLWVFTRKQSNNIIIVIERTCGFPWDHQPVSSETLTWLKRKGNTRENQNQQTKHKKFRWAQFWFRFVYLCGEKCV